MEAPPTPWWNTYALDTHHGGHWQIGPSTLWLFRGPNEWRLMHRQSDDPMENGTAVRVPIPEHEWRSIVDPDIPDEEIARFSFRRTDSHLALHPTLADRPVVARPENAIHIPSGEEVTLYVSTSIWIRIELGREGKAVHEIPSYRPSDTWFGPSTREGELCYATRTTGRIRLDDLPIRPHRAVTPLLIRNQASDMLLLERVQIPAQHLALYHASDHVLWTQGITLHRTEGSEGAAVRINPGAPRNVSEAKRLSEPRQTPKKNLVMSTFQALGSLFSH